MRATYVALLQGPLAPVQVVLSWPIITYRPHPPHSQAQRNFIALRLICAAFAVRECLVARFSQIEGYKCLSLTRALEVVKCQLALV